MTTGTDDIIPAGRQASIIEAAAKSEETNRPPSSLGNSRTTCRPFAGAATTAQPNLFSKLSALLRVGRPGSGLGLHGLVQPAPVRTSDIVPEGGKFIEANTVTRREPVLTNCTYLAAIGGRRALWWSCCTAARSRLTISPPARA